MVGLLGGSFDPVHHGHLIVGQVAGEKLGLEVLRFVPAREQPFKRGRHQTSPEHRTAMLSLAIQGTRGFAVEQAELKRPGPSYTVDTLEELQRREPGEEFVLLLGADAALELHAWHGPTGFLTWLASWSLPVRARLSHPLP
jgi:nicotinate-nucleotide adenylyltransferase